MSTHLTTLPLNTARMESRIKYSTDIIVGASGYEVRNANWQDPLYSYNVGSAVQTKADLALLQAFFHVVRGRETAFLIKDYQDFAVTEWTRFAESPNGILTNFQLFKKYVDALSNSYSRIITKPKSGTVSIQINSTPVSPDDYTVSYTSGVVTFDSAPAGGSLIDFKMEFYVPVRFDTDELPIDLLSYWVTGGGTEVSLAEAPEVPLIEVRGA